MTNRAVFLPYRPKTILNSHKRPDHWFWSRYSAYPYTGCQHGCKFCYSREVKYAHAVDPQDFDTTIKVKENAADLLRRALLRKPVDILCTGDYQPAEREFGITRQMLEVCRELHFPVFMLSRSPLILRDLDLLREINAAAPSAVAFSVISTPESPHHDMARKMENLAPLVETRFAAMREIADTGILTGICFMPILPGVCDDEANLEAVIRSTAENGGRFVLAGGLTLADQQKEFFFQFLGEHFPDLVPRYQTWYPPGSYEAVDYSWNRIALRIRELCTQYDIRDRMPRPVIPGDKLAMNKRIVERLADTAYELEIKSESSYRVWAYRKAAWAVEDLETDIRLIYRSLGVKGLRSIPDMGEILAGEVEKMIHWD